MNAPERIPDLPEHVYVQSSDGSSATIDSLLVVQGSDLQAVLAQRQRFTKSRLVFMDPGLLDLAAGFGMDLVEFVPVQTDPEFQARATGEALALATLLDVRLSRVREAIWGRRDLSGWDVGLFHLALQRLVVAKEQARAFAAVWEGGPIALLRPTGAQRMYFDCAAVTELFRHASSQAFVVADEYDQVVPGAPDPYAQVIDGLRMREAMASGLVSLVTHLPTCYSDSAWLAAQISRAHSYTIDLPSSYWDIPIHRGGMAPRVPSGDVRGEAAMQARRYRDAARPVLESTLGHLLVEPSSARAQLDEWADRCHWQALSYEGLRRGLAGFRPAMLVADQDTGLNGPLFSAASEVGSPVTVFPHSGHPSTLLPHARGVRVVERPGFGTVARTVLGHALRARPVRTQPALARQSRYSLRRVCLMLNALYTVGLSLNDMIALAGFYRSLQEMCRSLGISVLVRSKPSVPTPYLLGAVLGIEPQEMARNVARPLAQVAEETDLCITYGEPTTGVAPFLESGCLVVHVAPQHWPQDYVSCLPLIHDGVIASLNCEDGAGWLRSLAGDAAAYGAAVRRQCEAFDQRAAPAEFHLFPE